MARHARQVATCATISIYDRATRRLALPGSIWEAARMLVDQREVLRGVPSHRTRRIRWLSRDIGQRNASLATLVAAWVDTLAYHEPGRFADLRDEARRLRPDELRVVTGHGGHTADCIAVERGVRELVESRAPHAHALAPLFDVPDLRDTSELDEA